MSHLRLTCKKLICWSVVIEHLFHVRYCARPWGPLKNKRKLCFHRIYSLVPFMSLSCESQIYIYIYSPHLVYVKNITLTSVPVSGTAEWQVQMLLPFANTTSTLRIWHQWLVAEDPVSSLWKYSCTLVRAEGYFFFLMRVCFSSSTLDADYTLYLGSCKERETLTKAETTLSLRFSCKKSKYLNILS